MTMTQTIQTGKGPRDVPAYGTGVPGLVVHKSMGAGPGRHWTLTHRASGLALSSMTFTNRAEAIDAARRVADLADWSLDRDGMAALVRADLGLGSRVRAALIGIPEPRPSVVESILPDGWELIGDDYDGSLVCPCGDEIEMDGVCSSGCVSPLRTAGLI